MSLISQIQEKLERLEATPLVKEFVPRFKAHYKLGNIWTLETGCLIFTSWIIYYLLFASKEGSSVLDIIVTVFFFLGALTYVASTSLISRLSQAFAQSDWTQHLKTANRYLFMVLSFLPGLYFAFKYEYFILRFYLVIHLFTSSYFFYKRFRDFQLEPFLIGVGMSVALFMIGPIIRGFFAILGSGWFLTSCASFLEGAVDLGLAVAFLLRLPQKYLPANMMFGLKIVRYLMCFLSWQTWFILMIFATWSNLGASAQAFYETYHAIEVSKDTNSAKNGSAANDNGTTKSKVK